MKTVGSILKKARQEKGLSLEDVEKAIKIRKSYLEALEASEYKQLPSAVFIKGFIKTYAQFLDLKEDEVIAFWRREYDEKQHATKESLTPPQPLKKERIIFTPSLIISIIAITGFLAFLVYIYMQFSSFALSPVLVIDKPLDQEKLTTPFTEVIGRTDPEAKVTINGQEVSTAEGGTFIINIDLVSGKNTIEITATNKFLRKTTEHREVLVQNSTPTIPPAANGQQQQTYTGVYVEVLAEPEAAWILVEEDGVKTYEGVLSAGAKRTFEAAEMVKIRTGKANSTKVIVNGKNMGVMGPGPDPLEREFRKP